MPPEKISAILNRHRPERREDGNVLMIILVAIALLAMLTALVSRSTEQQSDSLSRQTMDDEISRMLTQTSALGGALSQMIVNGENAATLYQAPSVGPPPVGLDMVTSGAPFETAPHNLKIYHPMGGGINFMPTSSPGLSPAATSFNINAGSIITGVGADVAGVGDIVFTALISSAAYCQRINTIISGSSTVPGMAAAAFTTLFTSSTAVTINAAACASCVNVSRLCVSNGAGLWGFYSALLPG